MLSFKKGKGHKSLGGLESLKEVFPAPPSTPHTEMVAHIVMISKPHVYKDKLGQPHKPKNKSCVFSAVM